MYHGFLKQLMLIIKKERNVLITTCRTVATAHPFLAGLS